MIKLNVLSAAGMLLAVTSMSAMAQTTSAPSASQGAMTGQNPAAAGLMSPSGSSMNPTPGYSTTTGSGSSMGSAAVPGTVPSSGPTSGTGSDAYQTGSMHGR